MRNFISVGCCETFADGASMGLEIMVSHPAEIGTAHKNLTASENSEEACEFESLKFGK